MKTLIVLAAGYSSRMNRNKMMILLEGKPIIICTIKPFLSYVDQVIVVTGHYQEDYQRFINTKLEIKHNPLYENGMFSSILKGVDGVIGDVFIIPGDYPIIKESTIKCIVDYKGDIIVPTYNGRKGHPIFLEAKIVELLKKEPLSSNLREFRDRFNTSYVEVDDIGIILDADDEVELQKIKQEIERNKYYED